METFKTQFTMSGVPTDVTVYVRDEGSFACALNLADFFDGGEFEGNAQKRDVVLGRSATGDWQFIGESRVNLTPHDTENLGEATDTDYNNR